MVEQLLEILMQDEFTACSDLCGKLPNRLEEVVCDLACDSVGLKGMHAYTRGWHGCTHPL